jgi:YrbI family 3-deoxy-D-manno-octulosonate 8-phosphate phosphatase
MNNKIWFVFDIDGVVTDGCVYVGKGGEEQKRLNLKDIDALYELAERGYSIVAVTAESNEFTEWVSRRFPWKLFFSGVKNKSVAVQQLRADNQIEKGCLIYIGDSKKDLNAFMQADYRICPSDAIDDVLKVVDVILRRPSGTGALWELIELSDKWFSESKQSDE